MVPLGRFKIVCEDNIIKTPVREVQCRSVEWILGEQISVVEFCG